MYKLRMKFSNGEIKESKALRFDGGKAEAEAVFARTIPPDLLLALLMGLFTYEVIEVEENSFAN